MCWPQLTGSCSQGNPPSHTSSPNEFHVQDDEQLFDPKIKRLFSLCFVFSTFGSRHLPSGRRMSKDLREVLVSAAALGRRVKTWDFWFRLQDIIVRKLVYSVGFRVENSVELRVVEYSEELELKYSVELKLCFSVELINQLCFLWTWVVTL